MTEFELEANAQMHWDSPGTWNFEKLHLELKYLGRNPAEARLMNDRHCEGELVWERVGWL